MKQKQKNRLIYTIAMVCACMILILIEGVLLKHTDFSVDEVFSYGLSNHIFVDTTEMKPQDGHVYQSGIEPFVEYMAVQPDERFQYANVWKNQSEDVHPPLYYAILHTICSFFPMSISRWYAGSINVFFLLMTMLISYKLVGYFTNKKISLVYAFFFATSSFVLNTAPFLRMYNMAMFWCTLYIYLFIKSLWEEQNVKTLLLIYITAVLGALTHYYVIVYLVLLSIVYGVILLIEKKYREVLRFCITMVASAITSLLVFPAMLKHLLVSNRGKESLGNAVSSFEVYFEKIKMYMQTVFWGILGNMSKVLIVLMLVGILLLLLKRRKNISKEKLFSGCLLLIPTIVYILLICKISVYVTDRYMYPVYGIIMICIFMGIVSVVNGFLKKSWHKILIIGLVCVILNMEGFDRVLVSYMNTANAREQQELHYFKDKNCVYIYDPYDLWKIQAQYLKISKCNKTLFILDSEFETYMKSGLADSNELIVYISSSLDVDFLLDSLMAISPNVTKCETIEEGGYAAIYYLHS